MPLAASYPVQDNVMHFANEASAERQTVEAISGKIQRPDVVENLFDVRSGIVVTESGVKDLIERCLGALDPSRPSME